MRAYEHWASTAPSFCVSTRSSELTVVLEGELTLAFGPAQQAVRIASMGCCLLPRGVPHRSQTAAGTKLLILDLLDTEGLGADLALPRRWQSRSKERALARAWEHLDDLSEEELSEVTASLSEGLERLELFGVERCATTGRMERVKARLERDFRGEVRLGELAEEARLDRFYMARAFKQNYGVSPREYLQFLRLEDAIWSMLTPEPTSITRIAADSGHGDYSTFCRRIRRRFGSSPSRLVEAEARYQPG